jgi:hypothetical protein
MPAALCQSLLFPVVKKSVLLQTLISAAALWGCAVHVYSLLSSVAH